MKHLALGGLMVALLLSGCNAPGSQDLEAKYGIDVTIVRCGGPVRYSIGSAVSVNGAKVSAEHVTNVCSTPPYARSAEHDVSILVPGKLPTCRNPEIGEPVVFIGFPTTDRNGQQDIPRSDADVEYSEGVVRQLDVSVSALGVPGVVYNLNGLARADVPNIRGGYSGGAVVSLKTGEFLGTISASGGNGTVGYFAPVSLHCKLMDQT